MSNLACLKIDKRLKTLLDLEKISTKSPSLNEVLEKEIDFDRLEKKYAKLVGPR